MPENDAFVADMSAVAFLRVMGELSGLPPKAALEKAHEVLFHVGLGEARYRALGTYSLGMKQMAKLAQAIMHGPELVILDEPTNGLDPAARGRMLKLIREMKEEHGMNVVLCSHLLRDVEEVCDEVVILKDGAHRAPRQSRRGAPRQPPLCRAGSLRRRSQLRRGSARSMAPKASAKAAAAGASCCRRASSSTGLAARRRARISRCAA